MSRPRGVGVGVADGEENVGHVREVGEGVLAVERQGMDPLLSRGGGYVP